MEEDTLFEQSTWPFPIKRIHSDYPSPTERYFTAKYYIPKASQTSFEYPADDQLIMVHTNKISLVTLAPDHPVIKEKKQIKRIEFVQQIIDNVVTGKAKRGGIKLKPATVLCKIYCEDESIYTVCACMKATLIEINKKLIDNPQLIVTDTWSKGYIAILKETYEEDNKKILLDHDQYNQLKMKK